MWFLYLLGAVAIVIIVLFVIDKQKDNIDMSGTSIEKKFNTAINVLVTTLYQENNPKVKYVVESQKDMYIENQDMASIPFQFRIYFMYSTGSLIMTLVTSVMGQKIEHTKSYHDLREISEESQRRLGAVMANDVIDQFNKIDADLGKLINLYKSNS